MDTCEHCAEDRPLHQLNEDNPRSPWVCEMCSNILDRDETLGKPQLIDDMANELRKIRVEGWLMEGEYQKIDTLLEEYDQVIADEQSLLRNQKGKHE